MHAVFEELVMPRPSKDPCGTPRSQPTDSGARRDERGAGAADQGEPRSVEALHPTDIAAATRVAGAGAAGLRRGSTSQATNGTSDSARADRSTRRSDGTGGDSDASVARPISVTKLLDFRVFDSSKILSLRGGILMSIG